MKWLHGQQQETQNLRLGIGSQLFYLLILYYGPSEPSKSLSLYLKIRL